MIVELIPILPVLYCLVIQAILRLILSVLRANHQFLCQFEYVDFVSSCCYKGLVFLGYFLLNRRRGKRLYRGFESRPLR